MYDIVLEDYNTGSYLINFTCVLNCMFFFCYLDDVFSSLLEATRTG